MSTIDPRLHLLSEDENARIFRDDIVPKRLDHAVSVQHPVAVFVAGQPGAGKTSTTEAVMDVLAGSGGAIVVNSDYYKPFHPKYDRLLQEDDQTAAPYTSLDGRRWMALAEDWLVQRRANMVIETTMRDPGDFAEPARDLRGHAYRVEVAVLAVPESLSRLGIISRYHDQVQATGHGRLTETANHDASYEGVLNTVRDIDVNYTVDAVAVYRRGHDLLHENTLDAAGRWQGPPEAAHAVMTERSRGWNHAEARGFLTEIRRLGRHLDPSWGTVLAAVDRLADPLLPPGAREAALARESSPTSARSAALPAAITNARPPRSTLSRQPGTTRDRG